MHIKTTFFGWTTLLLLPLFNLGYTSTVPQKVGEIKGETFELTMDENGVLEIFNTMISGDNSFSKFTIFNEEGNYYYLSAKGSRDGKPSIFALELAKNGNELFFERQNRQWFVCVDRGCGDCSFTFRDGEIQRCFCEAQKTSESCKKISGIRTAGF